MKYLLTGLFALGSFSIFANSCLDLAENNDILQSRQKQKLLSILCESGESAAVKCYEGVTALAEEDGNNISYHFSVSSEAVLGCKGARSVNPLGIVSCFDRLERLGIEIDNGKASRVLCAGAINSAPADCFMQNYKGYKSMRVALECSQTNFSDAELDFFGIR